MTCLEETFPAYPVPVVEPSDQTDPSSVFIRGLSWPEVVFGEENGFVIETFAELADEHKIYYLPAYLLHAMDDYFYRYGLCLALYGWFTPDKRFLSKLSRAQLGCLAEVLAELRREAAKADEYGLVRKLDRLIAVIRTLSDEHETRIR